MTPLSNFIAVFALWCSGGGRGWFNINYRKTSNIRHTLMGNNIADHSDVIGASPVGATPTTPSFSTQHIDSMDWAITTTRRDENQLNFGILVPLILEVYGASFYWHKKSHSPFLCRYSCHWENNRMQRIKVSWGLLWNGLIVKCGGGVNTNTS